MKDRKLSCLRASRDDSDGDGAAAAAHPHALSVRDKQEKKRSGKSNKRIQRDSKGSNDGSFFLIRLKRRVVTAFYSTA